MYWQTTTRILVFWLALCVPIFSRPARDVLVMNNGDRLTCTIKRLENGVLYVGLPYADGDVSIDWSKIARVESNQLFIVKTQNGSVFAGTLGTVAIGDSQAKLQIMEPTSPENPVTIDISHVVDVRQTSEDFLRRWSGDIAAGISYSKGNNATQYNFSSDAKYQRERWEAGAAINSNLSANSGANTSTRNSLTLSSYHLLPWENYFYGGLVNFLQSSVQGIQLQTSVGGGIGRFLKDTNRAQIAVLGGLGWQATNYHQANIQQPTQHIVAAFIMANASLFRFSKTKLDINASVYPALSEPGRVRVNLNTSYFVKFWRDISWTTTFYGNWDNKPPLHFSGSDYGTTSGLSWDFGK